MHKERLYTVVGLFVVGGLALLITSAVFIYDAWLRTKVATYVMFFKGSLQGLETTAPVTYRGIKIGEVIRIEVTESQTGNSVQIPVYVQFFVDKTFGAQGNPILKLIQKGMVANITSPNFLTGHSTIEITPSPVIRPYTAHYFHNYPVFPTGNKFEKFITLDQSLEELKKTLNDIQSLVRSKEISNAFVAVSSMAQRVEKLADNPDILQAFKAVSVMAGKVDTLASELDASTPLLFASFNKSLKQIDDTTHSIQNFTDYLARYPESLLRGKK